MAKVDHTVEVHLVDMQRAKETTDLKTLNNLMRVAVRNINVLGTQLGHCQYDLKQLEDLRGAMVSPIKVGDRFMVIASHRNKDKHGQVFEAVRVYSHCEMESGMGGGYHIDARPVLGANRLKKEVVNFVGHFDELRKIEKETI